VVARRKSSTPQLVYRTEENAKQLERLTRLLALLVVKGESQAEKMRVLASAGFANTEIADLLGLTANAVNVALHRIRSKK
jgi:DNA-directed RNA polymerase specialized sigma24 family protein